MAPEEMDIDEAKPAPATNDENLNNDDATSAENQPFQLAFRPAASNIPSTEECSQLSNDVVARIEQRLTANITKIMVSTFSRTSFTTGTRNMIIETPDTSITRLSQDDITQNLIFGGTEPRTVAEVQYWLRHGLYPTPQDISKVKISVQAKVLSTCKGLVKSSIDISYTASKCDGFREMKRQVKDDWKMVHFRALHIPTPDYNPDAIQVHVRCNPIYLVNEYRDWHVIDTDEEWRQGFNRYVVHGRYKAYTVRTTYFLNPAWEEEQWRNDIGYYDLGRSF